MLKLRRQPKDGDRRRAPRHVCDFGARIVLDCGREVRCNVRDFSASGANLIVPSVLGIPEEFALKAPTGHTRRVRVRRRGVARLGVAFV